MERPTAAAWTCPDVLVAIDYADGEAADLGQMVQAIASWLGGASLREQVARFAFFEPHPGADAFERGEEVDARWQQLLTQAHPHSATRERLAPVIAAAAAAPQLRQLFPFTSMWILCFSRCTGYPYSHDIPSITQVGTDEYVEYEVHAPGGAVLGRGDAAGAVALVISNLPANCGPAVPGTPDMLDKSSN